MAEFPETLAQIDALLAGGDAAGLGALGHRLKGNGGSYGFAEISQVGAQIEQLGKRGEVGPIGPLVERLRQIHDTYTRAQRPMAAPKEG